MKVVICSYILLLSRHRKPVLIPHALMREMFDYGRGGPWRVNDEISGATALELYSVPKQCFIERELALLFAEYSGK